VLGNELLELTEKGPRITSGRAEGRDEPLVLGSNLIPFAGGSRDTSETRELEPSATSELLVDSEPACLLQRLHGKNLLEITTRALEVALSIRELCRLRPRIVGPARDGSRRTGSLERIDIARGEGSMKRPFCLGRTLGARDMHERDEEGDRGERGADHGFVLVKPFGTAVPSEWNESSVSWVLRTRRTAAVWPSSR